MFEKFLFIFIHFLPSPGELIDAKLAFIQHVVSAYVF